MTTDSELFRFLISLKSKSYDYSFIFEKLICSETNHIDSTFHNFLIYQNLLFYSFNLSDLFLLKKSGVLDVTDSELFKFLIFLKLKSS